jgi:hypothetical protein
MLYFADRGKDLIDTSRKFQPQILQVPNYPV